jgi:thioredoxin reductase (NADPH)
MANTGTPEPLPLSETPDTVGAYPRLSEQQIAVLSRVGERREIAPGDVLFEEGDQDYDFFVVLEGKVAMVEDKGGEERVLAVHGPGRFLGELGMLTGQAVFVGAVAREPGAVMAVPIDELRRLVARDGALGDLILRAFLLRRSILIELQAGLRIVGSRYSPDTHRLRQFAARNRLPHSWIDVEADRGAEQLLTTLGVRPEETPVVIWDGQHVLRNPSNAELARAIGLATARPPEALCDVVVVGAGPAGLASAVYGASEGLDTVVIDAIATGGQAGTSPRIENYLGFPSGISGGELAERATIQAEKFGARITVPGQASALERADDHYTVRLDDGDTVRGRSVVIATGVRYRRLPAANLERFEATSVYYAATLVEAQLCRGDPIAIVGGGNSAGQASLFLAPQAPAVHLVVREDDLSVNMSRYLIDQIERNPTISVHLHTEVRELLGGEVLEALVVEDNDTGEHLTIEARALFVFIGAEPHTGWLDGQLALDEHGFILTGAQAGQGATTDAPAGAEPLLLESSLPGLFAVGDVRAGSTRRVASAIGDGAMAIRMVHEHLAGRRPDGTLEREPAQPNTTTPARR